MLASAEFEMLRHWGWFLLGFSFDSSTDNAFVIEESPSAIDKVVLGLDVVLIGD